jgi:nicotinamide riboside kinase
MDVVHISFLLVGHTHVLIDQYFSVIGRHIDNVKFIGSHHSMKQVFEKCLFHNNKPLIQRKLEYVYDVTAALAPYIDPNLMYHRVSTMILIPLF